MKSTYKRNEYELVGIINQLRQNTVLVKKNDKAATLLRLESQFTIKLIRTIRFDEMWHLKYEVTKGGKYYGDYVIFLGSGNFS